MTCLLSTEYPGNRESMNIYLGETRLATRLAYEHDEITVYEQINTYYCHGDHLGSANIVSDFEGEKYEHLEYTPYGELWVEDTDAAYHTPFRFTSKEWDEETELYYYGARYMHPRNSTWISADPAGFELVNPMEQDEKGKLVAKQSYSLIEGVNWYSYCSNNPVKYVDPSGLEIALHGNEEEKAIMLEDINSLSYKQYEINEKTGMLVETDKVNEDGSKIYSDYIDEGIKDKDTTIVVTLEPGEGVNHPSTGKPINLNERGGGMTFYNDKRKLIISVYTGKNGYCSSLGAVEVSLVLMHELAGHAVPLGQGGRDYDNAVDIENTIRAELRLPLRPRNSSHIVAGN